MLQKSFEIFEIKDYIDKAMSVSDVKRPKPYPDGSNKVLRSFGLKPCQAVFVGDSVTDMKAGKNASCILSIGVLSGIGTERELRNAGADFVVKNVSKLNGVLKA